VKHDLSVHASVYCDRPGRAVPDHVQPQGLGDSAQGDHGAVVFVDIDVANAGIFRKPFLQLRALHIKGAQRFLLRCGRHFGSGGRRAGGEHTEQHYRGQQCRRDVFFHGVLLLSILYFYGKSRNFHRYEGCPDHDAARPEQCHVFIRPLMKLKPVNLRCKCYKVNSHQKCEHVKQIWKTSPYRFIGRILPVPQATQL
jgi:hypothetical protein